MNSSTSSSNSGSNSNQIEQENLSTLKLESYSIMTSRKIYSKILLAIVIGMGLSALLVHVLLELQGANKQGIMGRVVEAQAALPKIISEPEELVMFFGSSMTQAGFSPRKFDKDLKALDKDIKSFNFGFGGLNPYFQDLLSRRIADEFKSSDRKLKLALIEFNPFQATQKRWNRAKSTQDSFLTMLASDEELWEIAKQDLTRGILLFNIKYIRSDISAEMITSYYGRAMFPPKRTQHFEDDEATRNEARRLGKLVNKAFKDEYPEYKNQDWYYPWQGAGTIPEERSAETLKLFDHYYAVTQTEAAMKNDRLGRINSADIEEMHFEPLLIESFSNIIKNFQQISDKVEVVMLPRNTRWINYSEEGKARLAAAIKQIELTTGVTIVDHRELNEINPDMFRDTTHLARYKGDIAYTDYLVKQYADAL